MEIKQKLISSKWYPDFFRVSKEHKLLNLGCGDGPQTIIFSNFVREIVSLDINRKRIENAKKACKKFNVENNSFCIADAHSLPFKGGVFDSILCIDLIEHVENPRKVLKEVNRVLRRGGTVLITFPTAWEVYRIIVKFFGRKILKKKEREECYWDKHNQIMWPHQWVRIFKESGFKIEKSKASTMFPPLHLLGIPKFWFKSRFIRAIDNLFCQLPLIKYCGQACCLVLKKE
jgi:ubiquinone/menaquinone biosynthesis C-methylase UbiE